MLASFSGGIESKDVVLWQEIICLQKVSGKALAKENGKGGVTLSDSLAKQNWDWKIKG